MTWRITKCSDGDRLLDRIRGEYREMPDLQLTMQQASRLWQIETQLAAEVLAVLCAAGFLQLTPKGTFCRIDRR